AEARRPDEGEEFEQVACGKLLEAKPRRRRRRMDHQRQGARGPRRRIGRAQALDFALGREPEGAAGGREQGGKHAALRIAYNGAVMRRRRFLASVGAVGIAVPAWAAE